MKNPDFVSSQQSEVNSQKIIFIVGPTAAGKSAVAIELARRLNGEIVSCDAMQVYKEICVASDKPSEDLLKSVSHHLISAISVEEEFSVARYRVLAVSAIEDIVARGKMPIVCGGSGMYMMALLDGLLEGGEPDPVVRERLLKEAEDKGLVALFDRLRQVDPDAAAKINPNDQKRIVRALEVFEITGISISKLQAKREGLWGKYDIRIFGLIRPREELYARVEARIDEMFAKGLVDEVRSVLARNIFPTVSRLIGIPEVKGYIDGEYDLERVKYLIKMNTRHYVKRQMTWFRKDKRVEWVDISTKESAAETAQRIVDKT